MNALTQYQEQIASVAEYAKRTNFNVETGNWDVMLRGWINDSLRSWNEIQEQKEVTMMLIKGCIEHKLTH